jgi:hypothetical protein
VRSLGDLLGVVIAETSLMSALALNMSLAHQQLVVVAQTSWKSE